MKKAGNEFVDFGAPGSFGVHIFRVEIPENRAADIIIVEDFGYKGAENGIPQEEERVYIKRLAWTSMAEIAKREFNDRLKAAKIPVGRWHSGENLLDRLLGKELCVLAWACETATEQEIQRICSRWAALRPEERWWLFSMTVAEAGLASDVGIGWRRALFYALAGSPKEPTSKKRPRPKESDVSVLPLFNISSKGSL